MMQMKCFIFISFDMTKYGSSNAKAAREVAYAIYHGFLSERIARESW